MSIPYKNLNLKNNPIDFLKQKSYIINNGKDNL